MASKVYPTCKYHPEKEPVMVHDEGEEQALGAGWFSSPADYGVELCPAIKPDPVIIANKKRFHKQDGKR